RIARGGQHGDEMVSEGLNADVRRTAVPAPSAPPGLRAARRSHANARLSGDARDRDGGIRKLEYVGGRSFVFYSGCPYDWHHFSISDFTSNPRNAGVCFDGGKSERDGPMTPKAFHALFGRIGARAKMQFPIHPHMLRHGCGYALVNAGHDTRALQAW